MLSYLLATVALAGPGPRSDADIADAIETELFLQEGVAAWPIDIDVRKGVVTLTGTRPHLLAADRARDVTAAVRGVRSVVDRLEVAPLPRDDEDIYDDITHRLAENPVTEAWEVDVGVDEGRVKLTGTVDSWHEKDLAARVARSVSGVHRVDDDLTWRPEKDRADPEIRAEIVDAVLDAVRWDVRLQAPAIDVAVRKGRVKLSGTVGSHQQKLLAERHAWVTGVHQVRTNQLEVQAWADVDALDDPAPDAVSDEGIADAVVDAWVYDPRVAAWQPELQVHDGAVTLRGIVPSFEARQAAEKDARNTRGVRLVRNRLRVRPEEPVPDDTLQGRVRESLQADPSAAIDDVTVRVRQGVVELGGTHRPHRVGAAPRRRSRGRDPGGGVRRQRHRGRAAGRPRAPRGRPPVVVARRRPRPAGDRAVAAVLVAVRRSRAARGDRRRGRGDARWHRRLLVRAVPCAG